MHNELFFSGKLMVKSGRLWKNLRGFHSNHIEAEIGAFKKWARTINNGRMFQVNYLEHVLGYYTFVKNVPEGSDLSNQFVQAMNHPVLYGAIAPDPADAMYDDSIIQQPAIADHVEDTDD